MSEICVNSRINPRHDTKLRLFADPAGHCSRPECHRYLFSDSDIADYRIGEMAHIIAASEQDLPYRENPEAEEAVVWKRKMLSQIIPNNQKILLFTGMNVLVGPKRLSGHPEHVCFTLFSI